MSRFVGSFTITKQKLSNRRGIFYRDTNESHRSKLQQVVKYLGQEHVGDQIELVAFLTFLLLLRSLQFIKGMSVAEWLSLAELLSASSSSSRLFPNIVSFIMY